MRAPLHLQLEIMRCDPAFPFFVSDLRVNGPIHPENNLIRGEAARRIRRTTKFPIDNIAYALQHAPHNALGHDRVASWFWSLILFVRHTSKYEVPLRRVHGRAFTACPF